MKSNSRRLVESLLLSCVLTNSQYSRLLLGYWRHDGSNCGIFNCSDKVIQCRPFWGGGVLFQWRRDRDSKTWPRDCSSYLQCWRWQFSMISVKKVIPQR